MNNVKNDIERKEQSQGIGNDSDTQADVFELKPNYIIIDGLNVLGRAQNHWSMDSWFGLIQVLQILKSLSSRVMGGLEVITVLREHSAFEREYVQERLEWVSQLSRLILLSDRSNKEDDDYVVMSLAKLHNAYFISHDLSIHEHIGEHDAWANKRRILIQLDPVTRGIWLEIPPGEVKDGYDKLRISEHLLSLLDTEQNDLPQDQHEDEKLEDKPCTIDEPVEKNSFGYANCTYCGVRVNSMEEATEHSGKTGHNHYHGWSLPAGGLLLEEN